MKFALLDTSNLRPAATLQNRPDGSRHPASAISSQQLFAGRQEITIAHGDGLYQLRQTRSGKLILTK